MEWGFAGTAFGGALVEFVEAAIIVIAAAGMAGWRPALAGTLAAAAILVAAVAVLGLALWHYVPIDAMRGVVGALLALFGVKWLAKASWRLGTRPAAGHHGPEPEGGPRVAFATAFNGVLLEGAEVVFIVVALGTAGRALRSAVAGAVVACVLVALAAAVARAPLSRVPDVVLKYVVGIMLTSFGTFWLGEALGVRWWPGEAALVWLALGNLALTWLVVTVVRRGRQAAAASPAPAGEGARA